MAKFPHYFQLDAMDCGPTCLRIISEFYGRSYSLQTLRDRCSITREGVSLLGISDAANSIGLRNIGVKSTFETLKKEATLPCIVHWNQNHFVVVYKITSSSVFVSDPGKGLLKLHFDEFQRGWLGTSTDADATGICLLLEPSPEFYSFKGEDLDASSYKYLFSYLKPYKKYVVQLILGLLLGSVFMLIFPFLTQSIVDIGVNNQNLGFITLVLIAQLVLFVSLTSVEIIRSWILLHLSTRVNVSLVSDFLTKMMKLPVGFFNARLTGDLLQRINDHSRIERFLTTSSLNTIFSFFNLIVFGIVLIIYSLQIFLVFLAGTILYLFWIRLFMAQRRKLDNQRFEQRGRNQNKLIELIDGVHEIKMNGCETRKRWEWETIQARLFKVNMKSLSLAQTQNQGAEFILRLITIFSTFLAARYVISGHISLGAMLAIAYIIGQLSSPIDQLLEFVQTTQDAKISLERLGEIRQMKEEEQYETEMADESPTHGSIDISNASFQYEGERSPKVLDGVTFTIPEGKTTAIVGVSGSGKTTLMKLILGFYTPIEGEIKVGNTSLKNISPKFWRQQCGVVLQDGYLFSDTIARNIALADEVIDKKRLFEAAEMACIAEYINRLPLAYNTKIGQEGIGLSQGQKQRLLIARALYKNPGYLFFDEATNALDAENERHVTENLDNFAKGRTRVIIAHRLSTVKDADQIIVLDEGKVIEKGSHKKLIKKKGKYYQLVKEQLELGS